MTILKKVVLGFSVAFFLFCFSGCFASMATTALLATQRISPEDSNVKKDNTSFEVSVMPNTGWRSVTYHFWDSPMNHRINYGPSLNRGIEIGATFKGVRMSTSNKGFSVSKGNELPPPIFKATLGYYSEEYDVRVNGVKDRVDEWRLVIHGKANFDATLFGMTPFIRSGFGYYKQSFRRLTLDRTDFPGRIGAVYFDAALGLDSCIYDNFEEKAYLSFGLEFQRIAVGSQDALIETGDGFTERYVPFVAFRYQF